MKQQWQSGQEKVEVGWYKYCGEQLGNEQQVDVGGRWEVAETETEGQTEWNKKHHSSRCDMKEYNITLNSWFHTEFIIDVEE